jgi:hypothetical protein
MFDNIYEEYKYEAKELGSGERVAWSNIVERGDPRADAARDVLGAGEALAPAGRGQGSAAVHGRLELSRCTSGSWPSSTAPSCTAGCSP